MISKIKGTQDFLDLTLFNFFIDTTKKYLGQYNYKEISTPIIEPIELFVRSVGEHTDIVSKEMFTFTTKGEEVICLRPEATASVVRAFTNADQNDITLPWKVFTYGPMFRYERPQKGRYRQFHQVSMEVIGSNAVAQDAQFIKMLDQLFRRKLNLDNYVLALNYLGCAQDRVKFTQTLRAFLDSVDASICQTCRDRKEKNTLRIFDCKNQDCQEVYKTAPKMVDDLCTACLQEWHDLRQELDLLSVSYVLVPNLVRGLDYYNKTVFEFISTSLGAQNTFCGGGRYDQLVSLIGGKHDQPSIGAAMGIERVLALLEEIKEQLPLPLEKSISVIIPLSKEQHMLALLLASELINAGICVETLFEEASVKSMMRKANKLGAKFVLLLGEEEQKNRTVTLKNMLTGEEKIMAQTEVVKELK